jgi:hypothetical protein
VIAVGVLQRMAKSDSMLSKIYMRHVKYRSFYAAEASVHAIVPAIKKHQ